MDDLLHNLLNNLKLLNIKKISSEFSFLRNDFDRFEYAYAILKENSLLSPVNKLNNNEKKNASESSSYRKEGNIAFQNKQYLKALEFYSKSVAFAPHESNCEELALALANRSVVLFSLEYYDLSLKDIDLAIKHHYPLKLKYKIFERKGRILQLQGDEQTSFTNFKVFIYLS